MEMKKLRERKQRDLRRILKKQSFRIMGDGRPYIRLGVTIGALDEAFNAGAQAVLSVVEDRMDRQDQLHELLAIGWASGVPLEKAGPSDD